MFSIFKRPKNQQFKYQPRFYDPVKEEIEQRVGRYKTDGQNDAELAKQRIRSGFKNRIPTNNSIVKEQTMKSNIRLVVIIAILILLAFMLLQSEGITKILQSFE